MRQSRAQTQCCMRGLSVQLTILSLPLMAAHAPMHVHVHALRVARAVRGSPLRPVRRSPVPSPPPARPCGGMRRRPCRGAHRLRLRAALLLKRANQRAANEAGGTRSTSAPTLDRGRPPPRCRAAQRTPGHRPPRTRPLQCAINPKPCQLGTRQPRRGPRLQRRGPHSSACSLSTPVRPLPFDTGRSAAARQPLPSACRPPSFAARCPQAQWPLKNCSTSAPQAVSLQPLCLPNRERRPPPCAPPAQACAACGPVPHPAPCSALPALPSFLRARLQPYATTYERAHAAAACVLSARMMAYASMDTTASWCGAALQTI